MTAKNRKPVTCVVCGIEFEATLSAMAYGRKHCSQRCLDITRSAKHVFVICKTCGKEFRTRPDRQAAYCSRACMETRVTLACLACGEEFVVEKARADSGSAKYCSLDCYSKVKTARRQAVCRCCNKEFERKTPSRKYCSMKCWREYRRKHLDKKNAKICLFCGKEFILYRDGHTGDKYCSGECRAADAKKQVSLTCPVCGKEFTRLASSVGGVSNSYCSHSCYLVNGTSKRKHSSKCGMTSIEKACHNAFAEMGFVPNQDFIHEYPVGRKSLDFYFPNYHLAVEANGDYWHSTEKSKARDRKRTFDLEGQGITVLEWRECDINSSLHSLILHELVPLLTGDGIGI